MSAAWINENRSEQGFVDNQDSFLLLTTVDVSKGFGRYHNLKNYKEATEDTEGSTAGCAGEGKQNKGNYQKRIGRLKDNRQ